VDPEQLDLLDSETLNALYPEQLDEIPDVTPETVRTPAPAGFLVKVIESKYSMGGHEASWTGTITKAMDISLSEVDEHAGGNSPAYVYTQKVFDEISELVNSLALEK